MLKSDNKNNDWEDVFQNKLKESFILYCSIFLEITQYSIFQNPDGSNVIGEDGRPDRPRAKVDHECPRHLWNCETVWWSLDTDIQPRGFCTPSVRVTL